MPATTTFSDPHTHVSRHDDGGRGRVRHLGEPGSDHALCGARRGREAAPAESDLCVVCRDLARRPFVGR